MLENAFNAVPCCASTVNTYLTVFGMIQSYGLQGCSPPDGGLCDEASTRPVARPGRSLATMFTDNYMGGPPPHW